MKFVSLEKQSKKKQKEYHAQKRGSWQGINPCSQIMPDRKKFQKADRAKAKKELQHQI